MLLTLRQRTIAIRVAAEQKGSLVTRELWDDVQNRLALSETERTEVFRPLPGTDRVLVDVALFDRAAAAPVELEKQERRHLLDALQSFNSYEQGDPAATRQMIALLEDSLAAESAPANQPTTPAKTAKSASARRG